ncbi:rhomboid family intramembrane serine protease [Streptomyces lunaelactis]|uniref:rhomboid family intramembrane serine protease n=1 Tax=Streptomyces lunaelactis TaxID=1535768 RepID=UPI0015850B9B|nr:rhomboid family intramembrane serine protease [Streptomyces lunaelactis]NUK10957.1 rhomboid family intramembrane serine protease [Streptomyces lunaelactis]NUK37100.1 rhomboid family intramembrane serine protease [Streptomyces lunaelactis]NUK43815.1 rhomboid family intramembrane serine protease [Streptomyces lunaelactis]NUK61413.1 rhomboid family intramembrane serine protease [Streptomyces lunaelactis]NUK74879.1 rhomboid family intramembrane serine protease [Streptomyces lunaelactis]
MDQAPGSPQEPQDAHGLPSCYRHPGRDTGIRCTRCERPICPDCMVSASVGFQCPECVRTGSGTGHGPTANQPRTVAGGTIVADSFLVTKILVAINVAVFVVVLALRDRFVAETDLIGYAFSPQLNAVVGVADGEWYRLLTSTFLHQEVSHILFNMVSLWFLGRLVEPALGRSRFIAVYLLSGLGGSTLAYLIAAPNQPSLGASGAIFGLMGAFAVLARRVNLDMRPVIAILALSLLLTFTREGISWEGHIGGLVVGALVTLGLVYAPREHRTLVQVGTCALVLIATVGIVVARTVSLT